MKQAAAILCLLLFQGTGPAPTRQDRLPGSLTGVWVLSLRCSDKACASRPSPYSVRIALVEASPQMWSKLPNLVAPAQDRTLYYGIYDVDYPATPAQEPDDLPLVLASERGDSVYLDFNPQFDHGGITLRGLHHAKSIKGEWFHRNATLGSGAFTLDHYPEQ